MKIWLDIVGYVGMALVILSMMMTDTKKLRMINLGGSVVSMAYGILTKTWPTAWLNFSLAMIQIVQLIRMKNQKA